MNNAASSAPGEPSNKGPLAGMTVIDMTSVLMGPSATQVLGDFGADVIKVESLHGDSTRYVGVTKHHGMSCGFLHINRNKRSIALDLKSKDGRDALLKLIAGADVLAYNVRPAAMARLGLGYDDLTKLNPRLVYCGMYGFAEAGPYRGKPAYDDLIQALTGMSALMAEVGDEVPRYLPVILADRATGQAAVNVILGALLHRERTGRGQSVEVTMLETMVPFVLGDHMGGETFVPAQGEMGYRRVLSKARRAYHTLDGNIAAVVYTDTHWQRFFEACGQPNRYKEDARLQGIANRTRNIDALYSELSDIFATKTTEEWMSILERCDIPSAPVHTLQSLLHDPHLTETGFFRTEEHPTEGTIRSMPPLGVWSDSPPSRRRPAPLLGEHTRELLREAGCDEATIDRMLAAGSALAPAEPNPSPGSP